MSSPSPRPVQVLAAAFLVGATYGVAISVLHQVHNRLTSAGETLALLFNVSLLYALWVTACVVVVALPALALRRWLGPRVPRPLTLGLLLFHLAFWEAFFLYGLTYEQTLLVQPQGFAGMVAYLLVFAVLIGVAAVIASVALSHLLLELVGGRQLALAGAVLLVTAVALHLALAWTVDEEPTMAVEAPQAPPTAEPREWPVVLVGLDGLDTDVVERLVAAGELPTFERLMREGVAGDLATIPDANSAVIWASMYSGATPTQHGIHDFYRISLPGLERGIYPVHRTWFKEWIDLLEPLGLYERRTVTRADLAAAPVWEVADWSGLSIGLVDGYFYSFPALEPASAESFFVAYGADGFARQLQSGGMTREELDLFVQPETLFSEIGPLLPADDFEWQSATLLRLLEERGTPRFVNLYTHEPDSVQHRFWKWWEPELFGIDEDAGTAEQRDAITDMHRRFDRFLARLLERIGDDAALIIASDHGHVATIVHALYSQHRHGPPGMMILHGGPFRSGSTLDHPHVYDLAPTLFHLLGLPVPEDAPGRVWSEVMEPDFLERAPVRRTASYRPFGLLRADGPERSDVLDREEIEKLKALGYI